MRRHGAARSPQSSPPATPLTAILAVTIALAAATFAEELPKLRLGSDVWPPFTNSSGEARIALDLVETALERGRIAAMTSIADWTSVTSGIRSDLFDGSAAIWRTDEREKFLLYSQPYLENRLVLVGRKGSDVSAPSLAALAGKRVALVEQYAYGEAVEGISGPIFVGGRNDQENFHKLLEGDVDYLLADELQVRYLLDYQGEEAQKLLEFGRQPLTRRTLHFAIRRDVPEAETIIRRFDNEIRRMLADGTYNEILELKWIHADVDGDGRPEMVARGSRAGEAPPRAGYSIVLPESDPQWAQLSDRFWVGSQVYEGWDSVPAEFKVPAGAAFDVGPPSAAVINLRVRP